MKVTMGTWHMSKQCVPGSLSSFPLQEPGNEARFRVIFLVSSNFVGWYINQIHFCIVVPDKGWSLSYIR